jgi:hypothetical protein
MRLMMVCSQRRVDVLDALEAGLVRLSPKHGPKDG